VIVLAMALSLAVAFAPIDPIRALFWSAVVNGVISVPIMAAMMFLSTRPGVMGRYRASRLETLFGWAATVVMALSVLAMVVLGLT
jgi:Mn2+/Fe2+ NRAMP family transporter